MGKDTTTSSSYTASLARARALLAREAEDSRIDPQCGTILLEHGQRARRALVCMHGITSSPVQFRRLGELFHSRGYNVLIPRMPRHGDRDRLTHEPARLAAAEYRAYVDAAIDASRGLGEHLTVIGLSVSGVLAAWAAQTRADVDLAMPIAPSFAPHGLPLWLLPTLTQLVRRAPNVFVPWDVRNPHPSDKTPCAYPRFSTLAMAESFHLGLQVIDAAAHRPPAAGSIMVVTNSADMAVNNAATQTLVRRWREHGARVCEHTFGPELGKMHDIIAPYQPDARVDYVYPILLELVDSSSHL